MDKVFDISYLPAIYLLGLMVTLLTERQLWRVAAITATAALGFTLASAAAAALAPDSGDPLGLMVALLVTVLGWVILRYSHRYLQGEPEQPRFARAMLFSLGCVALLVTSQHLLVMALAWSGTSVGVHVLLTFYRTRTAAQLAAHKKFLVSRLADLCLIGALLLVYQATGSLWLPDVNKQLADSASLSPALHGAALLFALATLLKSAQLPLHGWLIQVMEAPTPVSALLHAGIVNIGGFVLIRLAALLALAPLAQGLLVIVGSVTAILAGLVMTTRISIKVRLAWSTCAQMGFMLMEIGLGLYSLALLHLLAHSLYKAYAFLSAGDAVEQTLRQRHNHASRPTRLNVRHLLAPVASALIIVASDQLWQRVLPDSQLPVVVAGILALGLAPLLWLEHDWSWQQFVRALVQLTALVQLYFLWHAVFADVTPTSADMSVVFTAWVITGFVLLYVGQIAIRNGLLQRWSPALYPWLYNGFYLDETATRLTFKLWPPGHDASPIGISARHLHTGEST